MLQKKLRGLHLPSSTSFCGNSSAFLLLLLFLLHGWVLRLSPATEAPGGVVICAARKWAATPLQRMCSGTLALLIYFIWHYQEKNPTPNPLLSGFSLNSQFWKQEIPLPLETGNRSDYYIFVLNLSIIHCCPSPLTFFPLLSEILYLFLISQYLRVLCKSQGYAAME